MVAQAIIHLLPWSTGDEVLCLHNISIVPMDHKSRGLGSQVD